MKTAHENGISNVKGVPKGEYGNSIYDPQAEVGEHIQGKAKRHSRALVGGESNNAELVPANQFGRLVINPMEEVGEHVAGKRRSITEDLSTGEIHNAR